MAKILWIIHGYPPIQNAGAEWMAKEINDYLAGIGHDITVCLEPHSDFWKEKIPMADIVFTHLDYSAAVTELCQELKKPCINIIHHNLEISHLRRLYDNVGCVYNSEWVAKDRRYKHKSIVVHPPVNPGRFSQLTGGLGLKDGYVTLFNCNKDKGAMVFATIAKYCTDLKFLAVKGHHGPQITLTGKNITQIECQEDVRDILRKTSVLLIPSIYESYGRIGIEALAAGVRVIASDTPGLRESLGAYALFAPRNDIGLWLRHLRLVTTDKTMEPSFLKLRAANLWEQSLKELDDLNDLITEMINT